MVKLKRAKKTERIMKVLTGLTIAEFEALVITFTPVLQKDQATRHPTENESQEGDEPTP